jgi:excisionase family DNA binding protein
VTGRPVTVDGHALAALIEAATGPRPDPAAVRAALVALAATGPPTVGPWVSVDQAATVLGVSERTVRRAIARGDLAHRRVGRRVLVPRAALTPSAGRDRTRGDGSGHPA